MEEEEEEEEEEGEEEEEVEEEKNINNNNNSNSNNSDITCGIIWIGEEQSDVVGGSTADGGAGGANHKTLACREVGMGGGEGQGWWCERGRRVCWLV